MVSTRLLFFEHDAVREGLAALGGAGNLDDEGIADVLDFFVRRGVDVVPVRGGNPEKVAPLLCDACGLEVRLLARIENGEGNFGLS